MSKKVTFTSDEAEAAGIFDKFLNKRIKIFTQNGFCYKGELTKISSSFVEIHDIKHGSTIFNLSEIKQLSLDTGYR